MTLASWETKGWLRQYRTSRHEILELLHNAESDLTDARRDMPPGWAFSLAFAAVAHLCTTLLHASGYQAEDEPHLRAVQALPLILGDDHSADAAYLEACLRLRQQKSSHEHDTVTLQQSCELLDFVEDFYLHVVAWLRNHDSALTVNSDIAVGRTAQWELSLVEG